MPRGGGPERVMHHHGLRPGERLAQPGEVLVVVERVPAAPVDELDVRVTAVLPVVVVARAGMQQHVRDPGHRDVGAGAVRALGQTRRRKAAGQADIAARSVPVPESAARHADLAEHRGQDQAQPHRLLAVLGPLQRPADRDQRAPGRQLAGQRADPLRRDAGQGGRPRRGLRHAVGITTKVGREPRVAHRVPVQEPAIGEPFGVQDVAEREHQRGVGAGHRRDPFRAQAGVGVAAQRADRDDPASARHRGRQRRGHGVPADAARGHGGVLRGQPAERHQQVGVLRDDGPRRGAPHDQAHVPDHVRQQHRRGPEAVVIHRPDVTAQAVQEPVQLALGVVEPARAGPAVRPAEHAIRAVAAVHPAQLPRQQVERHRPGHGHEHVAPARRRAGAVLQPPFADIRLVDPRRVTMRRGQVLQDPAGRRILPPGTHRRQPLPVALDLRRTPVGEVDVSALLPGHDYHSSGKTRPP